jgi:MoxR-like ATPase
MLIGLLADGHILVEGAPGLAKTKAINVLSKGIKVIFIGYSSLPICYRLI